MKLILNVQKRDKLNLRLKKGDKLVDYENLTSPLPARAGLTINQGFDRMLLSSIDKITVRNRIDRLSLEGLEVRGKIEKGAVSGMILKTFEIGFEI